MKKTVFEGTVNGTAYDNVQDYNEAIKKALASGEAINANSETKTIDTEDSLDNNISQGTPGTLFPGFEHCQSIDNLNTAFIDEIVKDYKGEPALRKVLTKYFAENLAPAINNLNLEASQEYKPMVEKIMAFLGQTDQECNKNLESMVEEADKLIKRAEELGKAAEALNKAIEINSTMAALYNEINEAVSGRIAALSDPTTAGICDCGCAREKDSASQCPESYMDGVRRLCKTIFGD